MIFDTMENAHRYLKLNPGFAKAFDFLSRPDLKELPVGKYEIDGDRIFAMVAKDQGRKREDAHLETHEKFIDIQLVLSGIDEMGWKPKSSCKKANDKYDPDKDIQFFADEPDTWFATRNGAYAIFFPEDAHLPLISNEIIHKVVVKIAVA